MRLTRALGALLLSIVTVAPVGAQEAPASAPLTAETVPCPVRFTSDPSLTLPQEIEGQTYDCGVVVVPENYAQAGGRTIDLFYLRLRSTSTTPSPDPLIYLSGGPGGSATHEFSTIAAMRLTMQETRASRDIIVYDQRGTGFSALISCGAVKPALGLVSEMFPEHADSVRDLDASNLHMSLYLGACAAMYRSEGADLAQYNSVVSAKDIDALAQTLGYRSGYNLYGTSYGTRLALNATRTNVGQVRSVVLDGTEPLQIPGLADVTAKVAYTYQSLLQLCVADAACNAAYPDIDARFAALIVRLGTNPLRVDPPIAVPTVLAGEFGTTINEVGPDFFIRLADLNNLMLGGGFAGAVPRLILEFERGDIGFLRSMFAMVQEPTPATPREQQVGDIAVKPDLPFFVESIGVLVDKSLETVDAPSTPSDAWLLVVLTDLRQRLLAGEDQQTVIRAMVELSLLPIHGLDAQRPVGFANEWLSPAAATQANAIASTMSRHDLRATMWAIQDVAGAMGGELERGRSSGMLFAVSCAEDVPYAPREVAQRVIDEAPYPGLVRYTADQYTSTFTTPCQFYPPHVIGQSILNPAANDIPTLVFAERLDTQTPAAYASLAQQTLSRSYRVDWDNAGHVIAHRSLDGCAGAILTAFLSTPEQAPDTQCAQSDTYKVQFVSQEFQFPTVETLTPGPSAPASSSASSLSQSTWQWLRSEYGDDSTVEVGDPDRYTVQFGPDGRVNVQADCNRGSGSYTVNGSQLTLTGIALTRAACQPGSQDAIFLRDLAGVATFVFDGPNLVLNLKTDAGNMILAPAS